MDGRSDLSYFQLRKGVREKVIFDKEHPFERNKEQLPLEVFRTSEYEIPDVDKINTIQNFSRDCGNYFAANNIRRNTMSEVKHLTPLSRRQMWRIHRAADVEVERDLIEEVLTLNEDLYGRDPGELVTQLGVSHQVIEVVNSIQQAENQKIVP